MPMFAPQLTFHVLILQRTERKTEQSSEFRLRRNGRGNVAFAKIPIWAKEYCGVQGAAPAAKDIDPRSVYARVLFDLSCSQLRCSWLVSFIISKHVQFQFDGVSPVNP